MPDIVFPYTDVSLTEQVNRIPNSFGLLNAMNLFPSEGMGSRFVRISFEDGVLMVLPAEEPGAPGKASEREAGKSIIVEIPHFPLPDTILPADLQGILAQDGTVLKPKTLDSEVAKRLANIRANHAVTREFLRLGALKGLIKDGKGRTLYNLFTVFGIQKKTIDFVLGTAGTDVIAKCEELFDHIQNNLKGETSTGVEVIVSGTFFNKLVQHAKVEKYWLQTQNAQSLARFERDRLGGNWGRVFEFQNIMFREYKGSLPVRNAEGVLTSQANIESGYGHAYPVGTSSTFRTFDGPAVHINMVNEPGAEVVVTTKVLDHGAGIEFKSQSNTLPIVKRPEVLVEVNSSN
jgi:hypothetical protein